MSPPPWRLSALLILVVSLALPVRAEGLLTLKSTILSSDQATQLTEQVATPPSPALSGAAAGLTPIKLIEHYDETWLLARDANGTQVWLGYKPAIGWQLKTPPPAPLQANLEPGGQAHVLALALDGDQRVTLYAYHIITDTWAKVGQTSFPDAITDTQNTADGYIVTTRSNDGSLQHTQLAIELTKRLLSWIDWALIALYLGFTAAIGFYYYRKDKKHKNNEGFFLGGRNIPWWAAGVSLYATGTSALSYIGVPAITFAKNWYYMAGTVVSMVSTIFVAIWIVPLIRRLNLMSVYHYLEMRFHPKIRMLASALAILFQLGGRMSIVLFLPSLATAAVTGLDVSYCILIIGSVTIAYTVLGGMKAVIWTDFIQVVVMLGGAFVAIGYIMTHVDGGVGGFFHVALADHKLDTFNWDFNLTQATVWGFIILHILGVLVYPHDQVMMQRVLSTKSDKEAGWSVWTLAVIVVPGNLTFYAIGTALYVFYKQHPTHLNPLLNVDTTFPQFITGELPVGITGLIIAGIFAASMSTLSGTINSVATLISVDFYEKYWKKATAHKSLLLAEVMTVLVGLIGVGTALLLAATNIKSAFDTSLALGGLLGGGFAGCYALGLFTKRANWQGAFIGVGVSLVLTTTAWSFSLVHPFFYIVIANTTTILVGYLSSLAFPAPTQSLLGLTVYTPLPRQAPRSTPVG